MQELTYFFINLLLIISSISGSLFIIIKLTEWLITTAIPNIFGFVADKVEMAKAIEKINQQ